MRRNVHRQAKLITAALAALSTLGCGGKSPSSSPSPAAQACTGAGCTAVTLQQITVSPPTLTIAKGAGQTLAATGLFSDGSQQDLSSVASWTSSDVSVVTLGSLSGGQIPATGSSVGTAQVSASYAGVSGSAAVEVTAAALQSLAVTPGAATLAKGSTQQLGAFVTYTDGTTQEVTGAAIWSSSSAGVAAVAAGLVSAAGAGSATVSASYSGFAASAQIEVTPAVLTALTVTPGTASAVVGLDQPFTATGTFSDATQLDLSADVLWSTLDPNVASVSSSGLAHAVAEGSTVVRATLGAITGDATFTVTATAAQSLSITPASASFAKGLAQVFTATAHFTDGTSGDVSSSAIWSSSDETVVSITGSGLAQGLSAGTATVTATFQGQSASASLEVTPAAVVSVSTSPAIATLAKGTTQRLTATAIFTDGWTQDVTAGAQWASSDETVATANGGLVHAVAAGSTLVTASYATLTASTPITVTQAVLTALEVTPSAPSIPLGLTQQLTATGIFSDMTTQDLSGQVLWTTLGPSVATVSASGLVHAVAQGSTTVRAATLDGFTAETALTVTAATLSSIDVEPGVATMAKGTEVAFVATGLYSDGSTQPLTGVATWASSSSAVTFSNDPGREGVAAGANVGAATVTATFDHVSGTAIVSVSPAVLQSIAVTPAGASIPKGLQQQLIATGTFSDQTTQDVTLQVIWGSSADQVAAVSNTPGTEGLVTALGQGSATITATMALSTISGSTDVTVTPATVQSIAVAPSTATVPAGYQARFTATATYSDGSPHDVTALATWTSSNTAVATVSTSGSTRGLATGVSPGTASIAASLDGIAGHATLTVVNATLQSVAVAPSPFTVAPKGTVRLAATGTFSGGLTLDVTNQCVWSSSNKSVAWVSKSGVVTGVKAGSVTITAKKGNKKGTATGTVQ